MSWRARRAKSRFIARVGRQSFILNRVNSRFRLPLAIGVSVVAWASAWVSIRVAVTAYSPAQLALGRYIIASAILLPLILARRPRFQKADWPRILGAGLFGFTLYNLCLNAGEQTITAGASALIGSTIPVLSILSARLFLGERVNNRVWLGSAVALAGVALIAWGEERGLGFGAGAFLVMGAAVCAAIYNTLQKPLLSKYAALDVTAVAIFCGTLLLVPLGGGLVQAVKTAPLLPTLNLLLLGAFPGALGYVLWMWCLAQMPVARLMNYLYLVAPLSVLMGWLFLHELPSSLSLIGGTITLAGVVYSGRKKL